MTEDAQTWIAKELVCLWHDLGDARDSAHNRDWSMQCDNLAERIREATQLVGPVPWDEVPATWILDGTFAGLCERIKVATVLPTEDERVRVRDLLDRTTR